MNIENVAVQAQRLYPLKLQVVDNRTITFLLLQVLMLYIICVLSKYPPTAVKIRNIGATKWQVQYFRRKFMGPERPPSQQPLDATWQLVAYTRKQIFVYSAFVERRHQAAVILIAATSRVNTDPVFCRLWLRDTDTPYILRAKMKFVREHHNMYYGAVFVLCPLGDLNPDDTVNGSIALVSYAAPEKLATNLFKIMDTMPKNGGKPNLHICVRPLFGSIDNVEWMVEWIELNRMLGVSHFYFYNMSIGDRIDCMLKKYRDGEQLFTVLPFPSITRDIWAEGQLVSMHDCLYRSMSRADWLMLIDIDELVLPHVSGLRMLLQSTKVYKPLLLALFDMLIEDARREDVFAFVFRNAFFYLDYKDDPESPVPLVTSRKTKRLKLLNQFGVRSKYAIRPSKVIELHIHEVKKFTYSNKESVNVNLSSNILMLHHYREECIELLCPEEKSSIIDQTAHLWAEKLWKRVQKRLAEINQYCPIFSNSSHPFL